MASIPGDDATSAWRAGSEIEGIAAANRQEYLNDALVTVLIDTYNYGQFVEQAIESVLTQDFVMDAVEIVVVDDGSTDDTRERVAKYGSRIRYVAKENGGQASAFNAGFAAARGEIVATLDADDYFLPGKLRRVVEEFEKHPQAGMVYHARLNLEADTGTFTKPEFWAMSGFLGGDEAKLLRYELYPTSCLAFRREAANRLLPIPERLRIQADGHLVLLMPLIAEVVGVDEPLSVYRVHGKNLFFVNEAAASNEQRRKWIASFQAVVAEGEAWAAKRRGELKGVRTRRYFSRWVQAMQEREFEIEPPERWEYFRFLIRQNDTRKPIQSVRFTIFNYLMSVIALVFGYRQGKAIYRKSLERAQTATRG